MRRQPDLTSVFYLIEMKPQSVQALLIAINPLVAAAAAEATLSSSSMVSKKF